MSNGRADLLFFDTFSHDANEELNLDLVQFPKSVFVTEIRIIPLGARVEGDFPGGVRLGATNPTKFHIDFFVNDLSKPGACTFEALGSLEYCQNGQIHMECITDVDQARIPTDGLVLRGCYTTITLAVYGHLTQVLPETPAAANVPPSIQRPVSREVASLPANVPQSLDWTQDSANPIPSYTSNVAAANPESYDANTYTENYETPVYRNDYYENEQPKDPRTYHHLEDNEWEKERQDLSCEREQDRLRHSPRSMELDCDRRDARSRRRSLDRGRSRETSRHRDHTHDIDRIDRLSRSRSRDREYIGKAAIEYRKSRSRSRSVERDWERNSYKKDDYRRRGPSYDRSRGGSFERSPYDKRAPSYERKAPYDKGPYEKRLSPYDKRSSSYERHGSSPYGKRHSPYRVRGSSYGSRSPSRDEPRKRPRTPAGGRPLSPREGEVSPINSLRSEEGDYDRSGKQIPRVDFYHQSYRHKSSIRSPSQDGERPFAEQQHSSLVTVPIVDSSVKPVNLNPSPLVSHDDKSMDAEQFEPILSDEDICDDLEGTSYMDVEYDVNEYDGVDDIIKYYNPFKDEWKRYRHATKVYMLAEAGGDARDVMAASFDELCDASADLLKIYDITKACQRREPKLLSGTFADVDSAAREEWVHCCEQLFVPLTSLCAHSDLVLRIFAARGSSAKPGAFGDLYNMLVACCKIGLDYELALSHQQPTYKIRHMKCGIRLAEALTAHRHNGPVMEVLLSTGIDLPMSLFLIYSKDYMALSIRLMILKALNGCLSSKMSMEHFMRETVFPKLTKADSDSKRKPMNGYQALIAIMENNPLARIKFSISALIKKLNVYEVLCKLHELILTLNSQCDGKPKDSELSEADTEFVVHALEEVLHTYRSQCFHLSQPKRFLPASAQFEINKECSTQTLLEFFNIHHFLESCLFLLSCPATCSNMAIACRIHDLVDEMINSHDGLMYLYQNMASSEVLFRVLTHPYSQQGSDETPYPHDSNLSNYTELQVLGLEMAYRLKALYYLEALAEAQAAGADDGELVDRLQSLYCLSFGCVGRTAVPRVLVMGDNAGCLMAVFEPNGKSKPKADSAKLKSPAQGYAIELIVSAVRYAASVPFLKKYGSRLSSVCREHDRFEPSVSSVLQEAIPYLKPTEKPGALAGDELAACVDILKDSLEHAPDLPGELTTCLTILTHFCLAEHDSKANVACESPTDEYLELKYKYNVLQLFSLDGAAHLAGILDRLASHFDQPSMHTSFFASARGLQLAQILVPCLRLLDEMLARVVRCRGPRFRDITAAPILLKTYGIAKSYPVGCIGHRTAAKAAEASVRALLAYAQPIADDAKDGDSIRRGPWTSLCSEVISYTMTAPYTFVPGLLIFSELLPLPLPIQTRTPPTARELADASNERRLWSAHLHALTSDLTDMIQIICMSTYRPVVHMLRRVCVQIADLAPNTAATVAKAAVGAVGREVREGEPASSSAARVLGFLACLMSHGPVKCAVVHAMSSGPRPGELQRALCGLLRTAHTASEHAAAQEYAAHALAALCDAEVTLTPLSTASDTVLANSLPNRDSLSALLDATAECLGSATKACSVASAILRSYYVLTEHDYGFQHFRKFVAKHQECLSKLFAWLLEGTSEDKAECLHLYLELIKVLRSEVGVGPLGRKAPLGLAEVADMVGYAPSAPDHPVNSLERTLRERNADDEAISNANFLQTILQKLSEAETAASADAPEPQQLPAPEPLVAQFGSRQVYTLECSDERLSGAYWLNVPAPADDDVNDAELGTCDVLDIANSLLSPGGGEALVAAVRRLAGCVDARTGPALAPADDKRPAGVALSRVRGEGAADTFRSRPPNTSRPPSLHVDDFTALHQPYAPNTRGGRRGGSGTERGRFASAAPHQHYRQLRGRGAWEAGAQHFGHFPPAQYMMGGMGWGGGRMQRGPRHRSFMR